MKYSRTINYRTAVEPLLRAVEEDSNFALAWYNLSLYQNSSGANRAAVMRAIQLANDLPERDRQMMIGRLAELNSDYDEAERIYLNILDNDPRDLYALLELSSVYWEWNILRARSMYEAVPYARRALELAPDWGVWSRFPIAYYAIDTGDSGYLATYPPCDENDENLGALCNISKLVEAYDRSPASALEVDTNLSGYIVKELDWMRPDPVVSLELAQRLVAPAQDIASRVTGRWLLAQLHAARGRFRDAEAQLDSLLLLDEEYADQHPGSVPAIALEMRAFCTAMPFIDPGPGRVDSLHQALEIWDPAKVSDHPNGPTSLNNGWHDIIRLYLLGLLDARSDNFDRALQYADELDDLVGDHSDDPVRRDQASSIRALVAFRRGDVDGALELLKEVPRQFEHWRYWGGYFTTIAERHLRGEVLFALGQYDEALRWFRSLRTASPVLFNIVRFYYQARCLEAMGDDEAAIEDYRRFLDLWQNCDPDQRRLVEDAQQRLTVLGGRR